MTKEEWAMEEKTMFFQYEDKKAMTELLENVQVVLKDTDAIEEKKIIKDFLHKISDNLMFMVLGNENVGKSSFLMTLFKGNIYENQDIVSTIGVREIRYGEEELMVPISNNVTRCFVTKEELQGITAVDMQGVNRLQDLESKEVLHNYIEQSDALFVVFQADSINDYAVWDILENVDTKKVVFVLTKCDTVTPDIIEKNEEKVRWYMEDAGISAPVFKVSSYWEQEGDVEKSGLSVLRNYVGQNIIGENPFLTKQRDNVMRLKELLTELSSSFENRKRQHEADLNVLQKIDTLMDSFTLNSEGLIENLKKDLAKEIEEEIDKFQREIIEKFDSKKIKENFPNGSRDLINYMNFINDVYQKRMTDNVNKKTQNAIRGYLSDLENVFDNATGYFRKRESLLKLEDKFYGSLAVTKNDLIEKTSYTIENTKDYYKTLIEASQELFMQIWNAREEYDQKVHKQKVAGGFIGGVGGLAIGSASVAALHITGAAVAGAVVIPILLTTFAATQIAKKIFAAKNEEEMEIKVKEAIEEFKGEVSNTKEKMVSEILEAIDGIFRRELSTADKSFLDFRMSVNIDSRNIPVLEERMSTIYALLGRIEEIERKGVIQ